MGRKQDESQHDQHDDLLGAGDNTDDDTREGDGNTAAYFVARCFHARNVAHAIHLSTRSLAEHLALAGFYNSIVGMIDAYAETWQGAYDLLDGIIETEADLASDGIPGSSEAFLRELGEWIREERLALTGGCPSFDNLIDPIINLIDQTVYKLRFLS